jgi:hypothetical protein
VVELGLAFSKVVDEQVADRLAHDLVAVDELGHRQLAAAGRGPDRRRRRLGQYAGLLEEAIPMSVRPVPVVDLGSVCLHAVVERDVGETPTGVDEDASERASLL